MLMHLLHSCWFEFISDFC